MLFISQIAMDEKKVILYIQNYSLYIEVLKAKEVLVWTVPHVEGLKTKDLIDYLIEEWEGIEYLPDNYLEHQPHRVWVVNLCRILL